LLTTAASRDDRRIRPPQLPIAAARQVVRSLLNAGLAEEVAAPVDGAGYTWRTGEDGGSLMLRATVLGLVRITDGESTVAASVSATVAETTADLPIMAETDAGGTMVAVASSTRNVLANDGCPAQDAQAGDGNRGEGAALAPAPPLRPLR
jgi:delta 1-pyrroline-5-carboxylate dehydrogenase